MMLAQYVASLLFGLSQLRMVHETYLDELRKTSPEAKRNKEKVAYELGYLNGIADAKELAQQLQNH